MRNSILVAAAVALSAGGGVEAQEAGPAKAPASLEGVWRAQGDGLLRTIDGKLPPLKPAALKAYQAKRAAFTARDSRIDPARRCKPPGEPRLMLDPKVPFEIIQTPMRILFGYQWNRLVRMIEIGAPRDVIGPTYFGQNAGSWDGATLVVDVQALHDSAYLDNSGLPHGENARITERFTLIGDKQMEVKLHVIDPEVYSKPWDARVLLDRQPEGTRIKEDICLEREGLVGKI